MRLLWIKIHLYLATFFVVPVMLMATSGGLYLLGVKGSVETTPVVPVTPYEINPESDTLADDIRGLLKANNIEHRFEYIKTSGSKLITRPTSRTHYEFDLAKASIARVEPDLVKSMVELHKGHGPLLFKDLQKLMALGLLTILLSGFWLGLSSKALRIPTIVTSLLGTIVFALLALVI